MYSLFYVTAFALKGSWSSQSSDTLTHDVRQSRQPYSSTLDFVSLGSQIFMHHYPVPYALMCYMWEAEETVIRSLQSFHELAFKKSNSVSSFQNENTLLFSFYSVRMYMQFIGLLHYTHKYTHTLLLICTHNLPKKYDTVKQHSFLNSTCSHTHELNSCQLAVFGI